VIEALFEHHAQDRERTKTWGARGARAVGEVPRRWDARRDRRGRGVAQGARFGVACVAGPAVTIVVR
jgi:hypothetical protein